MLELSTANKAAVESDVPWIVTFVEIIPKKTDTVTHFRVCNHFRDIDTVSTFLNTDEKVTYTGTANLMSISTTKKELEVKQGGINIVFSGLNRSIISRVLDSGDIIQGADVYIRRGFIEHSTGTLVDDPYGYWGGFIENYKINDSSDGDEDDTLTISLTCISDLPIILRAKNGRYTSLPGFQRVLSTDMSMEFTPAIADWAPNFYKAPPDSGGTHLCTAYHSYGDISDEVFASDCFYEEFVPADLYNWYSSWAKDLAEDIRPLSVKYWLIKPFVMAWSQSMHYKVTGKGKRSYFGEFLEWIGGKICRL